MTNQLGWIVYHHVCVLHPTFTVGDSFVKLTCLLGRLPSTPANIVVSQLRVVKVGYGVGVDDSVTVVVDVGDTIVLVPFDI